MGGSGKVRAPAPHRREPVQFLTTSEVAQRLSVSERTVRRWIERGELIAHHLGAAVRIADLDLKAFLALRRDG
jgi:excisionase family DNA binding protein